jgi:beta-N-acetylhexosaminidase
MPSLVIALVSLFASATGVAASASGVAASGAGHAAKVAQGPSRPSHPAKVAHPPSQPSQSVAATRAGTASVPKPRIRWDPIPFGSTRKAQTAAYVRRHYRSFMKPTWRLTDPHVIVIHYTDAAYGATYNTFATDVPDSELHELPATCAHFVIGTDGTIHQLVSLGTICRHTVGLNWTAIGIEHVGFSDAQVLDNRRQIGASLKLVRWLRCRFHIKVGNVIGHNESLSSPYHHEDIARLRTQTHGDFKRADMNIYRRRLRARGNC